jgi:hypothetical protein
MASPTYESAIYKINSSQNVATRRCMRQCMTEYNCKLLPKELSFKDLTKILIKMQKVCFKDKNLHNENTKRIIELLNSKSERTFMVAISLGFLPNSKGIMDFVDGGAATVQKSNLELLQYQQPWINEVCRAKMKDVSGKSPVTNIMDLIERFVTDYLMKTSKKTNGLYLYVEKQPEHGDPQFLLNYYKKYGFSLMNHQDDEYFYMNKPITNKYH